MAHVKTLGETAEGVEELRESLLIAALIFSVGSYSAPISYNPKNLNCIGALSF